MVEETYQTMPVQDINLIFNEIDQAIEEQDHLWIEELLSNATIYEQQLQDRRQRSELHEKIRELRALRTKKIQEIENKIRNALAAEHPDYEQIDRDLDELAKIQSDHTSIEHWRSRLAELRRRAEQLIHIEEIQSELTRLWEDAEAAETAGSSGLALIGYYENARDYAETQAATYDLPQIQGLLQQAIDRYNQVRQRHEVATTRQQTGEYRGLLEQLKYMDPEERVLVSTDVLDLQGSQTTMPAGQAVQLLERQAREYAAQKAAEYRQRALQYLDEHAPGAAERQLREALELFNLDDEEKGDVNNLLKERVMPAFKRRQEAEATLRSAERQGTPIRRWQQLLQAEEQDPFLPDLDRVRGAILPGLDSYLAERLQEAKQCLSGVGKPNWVRAQQLVEEVRTIAEQDSTFQAHIDEANMIRNEATMWQELETDIQKAIADAKAQVTTDPHKAYEELLERQSLWEEKAQRFPEVAQGLASIQVHANISALIHRLKQAISDPSAELVEAALHDCEAALQENSPQRIQLEELSRRLRLHLNFLQGRALLDNHERTPMQERKALDLLKRVIDGKGDDLSEAQPLFDDIRNDQKTIREVQRAMQVAQRSLEQEHFEAAHNALDDYKHREETDELRAQIAYAWEQWLEKNIVQALARSPINEREVMGWVDRLDRLGAASAGLIRRQAISHCAAQRANQLLERPNRNWTEILNAWDEALAAMPNNVDYQEARANADKQKVRSKLGREPSKRIAGYQELVMRYPDDLDVRRWLVEAYIEQLNALNDYNTIEHVARQVHVVIMETQHLAAMQGEDRRMLNQLQEQADWVDAILDIAQSCFDIAQQMQPDKMIDAWQWAMNQAQDLEKRHADNRKFSLWWRQTIAVALADAQNRLATKQRAGDDIWDQIHPASQVLLLDERNNTARQTIQGVYEAILVLESQLSKLEQDRTGSGYPGAHDEILAHQLRETQELRRKLMLAEQVLMNFGGQFQDPTAQRGKIKELVVRNQRLIERLEQLQRRVNTAQMAINQAKSNEQFWFAYDEQFRFMTEEGYSHHLTVIALDRQKIAVQKKQQHLRSVRVQIEQVAQNGEIDEALRLAELMMGRAITKQPDGQVAAEPVIQDDLADPQDSFGEQARVVVQDPFTRRRTVGLKRLIAQLHQQADQVELLRNWLPILPRSTQQGGTSTAEIVRQPIVQWQEVTTEADAFIEQGRFEESRKLLLDVIQGNQDGYYGDKLALKPAVELLSEPPVEEQNLISQEASQLWYFGQKLHARIQADLNRAYTRRNEILSLEQEWQDCYQRFISMAENVHEYEERTNVLLRALRKGEYRQLQADARAAYNMCERVCPKHPDLAGWANHRFLGG